MTELAGTGADTGAAARFYVLLAWHPALGAAADPVGVLGVDERDDAGLASYVVWMPLTGDRTATWRGRLAEPPSAARIMRWLEEDGTAQLQEVGAPVRGTLAEVAEVVVDVLLAEVVPALAVQER
jgi:hypothetical protein